MSSVRRTVVPLFALALAAFAASPACATSWKVDPTRSTFAVLIHKAGFAAGLAHEHLIVAPAPEVELALDPAAPESARMKVVVQVLALEVDAPDQRTAAGPRLRELGATTELLEPVEEKNRPKVRKDMLEAHQLFADRFPEIRGELIRLEPRPGTAAAGGLDWNATVRLEIRGRTVESIFAARWRIDDAGDLHAEALGELTFTQFGIEPYSAVLGAVKNADLFHVWIDLAAKPAP
jgi:YceI-like domain